MLTPPTNSPAPNPLATVDAIVAGVEVLLLHPANFSNHLGDVYEHFLNVQEEHLNYVSLFGVNRLLSRAEFAVPAETREMEFPPNLADVGDFKFVRIVPTSKRLREVPIEIVPRSVLMNYGCTYEALSELGAAVARIPQALSWWNDGSVGRIAFSDTFENAQALVVWFEPAGKADLQPEAEANVLRNAHSYLKAELAMRLLDLFFAPGSPAYAARGALIERQATKAAAILDEWLENQDSEESGFVAGWGRAGNDYPIGGRW